jgi:hypothetical protein
MRYERPEVVEFKAAIKLGQGTSKGSHSQDTDPALTTNAAYEADE